MIKTFKVEFSGWIVVNDEDHASAELQARDIVLKNPEDFLCFQAFRTFEEDKEHEQI
jgi:hypothetical protein